VRQRQAAEPRERLRHAFGVALDEENIARPQADLVEAFADGQAMAGNGQQIQTVMPTEAGLATGAAH